MQSAEDIQKGDLLFSSGPRVNALRFSGGFHKIEREILSLLLDKSYQKIRIMLSSASNEVKKSFFEKHGTSILYHAVASSHDTEALKIIVESVSVAIVQELLRRNDFEILKDLVRMQYFLETYTMPGQTEEEVIRKTTLFREKLQFLSRIDPRLLSDFLEGHQEERYMSETVTQMIESAIPKMEFSVRRKE